jgi:hypothetical protein
MDKPKAEMPKTQPLRLVDALREARLETAERTGVVVDLKDAQIARLELLNEAVEPLFAEIPETVDLFDRGITRGDTPRLWIDMLAHVQMDRERRVYRFIQDTRHGPRVMAETASADDMVREITRYVARRMIERERALAADESSPKVRVPSGKARSSRGVRHFLLGVVLGVAAVFVAAWLAAGNL